MQQVLHALRFGQGIGAKDVEHAPVVQRADGDEQQLRIRHQLGFLPGAERAQAALAGLGFLRDLGQREAEQAADFDDPVEGKLLAGEQAFDAWLGQVERNGNVTVGQPLQFQLTLDGGNDLTDLVHGGYWQSQRTTWGVKASLRLILVRQPAPPHSCRRAWRRTWHGRRAPARHRDRACRPAQTPRRQCWRPR